MPTSMYNALFSGSEATRTIGNIINVTAATLTLTQATHGGAWITLNRAAGITLTLPNAVGSGVEFWIVSMTALSAASHIIQRGRAADLMVGVAGIGKAGAAGASFQPNMSSDNTLTMNATTTGGLGGDWIVLVDTAVNQWFVNGELFGSGTLATPFSTT